MLSRIAGASLLSGATLCAGTALAATPTLPNFGHYIGYATVVSASDCPATEVAGGNFQDQLELNTPLNRLVVLIRRVYPGSSPDYVPTIVKLRLEKTSGTHLSPAGNAYLSTEGSDAAATVGTYSATYTPLDPNSFQAAVTLTYPYTPSGGSPEICTETIEAAYIRSSAD